MKYIIKQEEPTELLKWKKQNTVRNKNKNGSPSFQNLNNKEDKSEEQFREDQTVKKELKKYLLEEQGYICCYCECDLSLEKANSHIEHFKPQNKFPNETLKYSNLLCCCEKIECCGHKKHKWFNSKFLISPLDLDCENKFSYTADGMVEPRSVRDEAALMTIDKLGLNTPKLVRSRKAIIDGFVLPSDDDASSDFSITQKNLQVMFKDYLELKNGKFSCFWTTIDQLAKTF